MLKKRRGRKKFIIIDTRVRDRLSKRDAKYLDKIERLSIYDKDSVVELEGDFEARRTKDLDETRTLNQINLKLEQIQTKEADLIDESVISLPLKGLHLDKRRRRTTHFTNAHRRRGRPPFNLLG